MSNALISYEFEDEPVRVVMIGDDPWWVANDVAIVLGYKQAAFMTRNLEDDEKGLHIVQTLGGEQRHAIISESGLYAAIFKSRRAEAKRFRKWVTSEVLPELRRTGRYVLHDPPPAAPQLMADVDSAKLQAAVAAVRTADRIFGRPTAREVWVRLGLPVSIADAQAQPGSSDPAVEPLMKWLDGRESCTAGEAAEGIGLEPDQRQKMRMAALLRLLGWNNLQVRNGDQTVRRWFKPGPKPWAVAP